MPLKKNYKKDGKSIKEIFLKMKKLRKEIMLTLEIKVCQMKIEKEKKEYMKKLIIHLINCVDKLENISVSK